MAKILRAGDRVKITIEGTVNTVYGKTYNLDEGDCISVELESGNNIGIEVDGFLSELEFEVIHAVPTTDGWYESERYPISDPTREPYRRVLGEWTCAGRTLSEAHMRTLLPLFPIGRVS